MVVAKSVKTRALRVALGAAALAAAITGVTTGTASAHDRDDGWRHGREYERSYRDHDGWRRGEWRHREQYAYRPGWYGYGYRYAPPPVVYDPPSAYYAPPPAYFPGALNFGFVIR